MEKVIDVGGRLHNPAVGGSLTGANEIKDDTKGKMQNVINAETDAELVRLNEAKQNNLSFDQTPTEESTNPVTSGGVYAADAALQQAIEAILLLIPSAATALNQLADKAFVNSSIATATAVFRGTYNLVTDLGLAVTASHQDIANALLTHVATAQNNDYCFVQIPVSAQSSEIRVTERYKFDGAAWSYEYDLNNSGFTADQWGAINSGITSVLVSKLGALPTVEELAVLFNGKQNTLTLDTTPTSGSNNPVTSGGLYAKFATIDAMIPTDADANNKLVAESRLVAYVTTLINALDATFDVTSADGHVTLHMTQADGLITSVQVLTSDIASDAALTLLGGRVSTAEADIDALQDAYAALTQSDIVIVNGALPSSGQQQNIIYRQPDQDHTPPQFYSDYMWNGTTWVLMATYNNAIDPRPKKGSQNLVSSGGVFDNMGALDVSELNATENPHTLAIYADLSVALAAIPSDYRKGGMSIKFVRSSDNKYVQYRLTVGAFTTDVTQWQGVDVIPTDFSHNLSESGGVAEYVKVGDETEIDLSDYQTENGYPAWDNSGQKWYWRSNDSAKTGKFIPITPNKKYRIIANVQNPTRIVFLKNNTHTNFSTVVPATGTTVTTIDAGGGVIMTAPSDATYLYVSVSVDGNTKTPQLVSIYNKIPVMEYAEQVGEDLKELTDDVKYKTDEKEVTKATTANQIKVWLDEVDLPDADSYKLKVNFTHPNNVRNFILYKGDAQHSSGSLTNLGEHNVDEVISITRDSSKPSLYIVKLAVDDTTVTSYNVTANSYVANPNSLEKRVTDLESGQTSLGGRVTTLEEKEAALENDVDGLIDEIKYIKVLKEVTKATTQNRFSVWLDAADQPSVDTFFMKVNFTHPNNVTAFYVYKGTAQHGGLVSLGTFTKNQEISITKDATKPSLYIYYPNVTDSTVTSYNVDVQYYTKNDESIEKRLDNVENDVSNLTNIGIRGKKIVVFGDSLTEFTDSNNHQWTYYAAQKSGATFINVAIGGTQLRRRTTLSSPITLFDPEETYAVNQWVFYKPSDTMNCYKCINAHSGAWNSADFEELNYSTLSTVMYEPLDIINMITAACNTSVTDVDERFKNQIAAAQAIKDHVNDNNTAIITRLKNIDWSTVDAVVVLAGTNDYGRANTHGTSGSTDINTTMGAVNEMVRILNSTYKNIALYYVTPTVHWADWAEGTGDASKWSDVYIPSTEDITRKVFYENIASEFEKNHIPVENIYQSLSWNMYNFSAYFWWDGTHPQRGKGFAKMGARIASFLESCNNI